MAPRDESSSPAEPDPRDFISPGEFAERSGLSLATVKRYLARGDLPKYQPGGKACRVLIPRQALESFASSSGIGTAPPASDLNEGDASDSETKQPRRRGPRPRWRRSEQ